MKQFKQAKLLRTDVDWTTFDATIDYKLEKDKKWKMRVPLEKAKKDLEITIHKTKKDWIGFIKDIVKRIISVIKNPLYLELHKLTVSECPGKEIKSNKFKANKNYWMVFGKKLDVFYTQDNINLKKGNK